MMRETSGNTDVFPNLDTTRARTALRQQDAFQGWHYEANVGKEKGRKCEQRMVGPNHCTWRLAARSEEGDRPLHSDKVPSLNIRFFAGSGTPKSAQEDGESKLGKLASA